MARVLLVQANYDISRNYQETPWMPVALVELASFIREKGHEVKIYDRNLYPSNSRFIHFLKKFNPDIVGMTCYTSPVIRDVKLISKITKENSKSMVIVGGIHATLEPKSLLDFPFIDYVIRGEGEYPLLEICQLIDKKKATKKNILKLKNINFNPLRPFINLDDLPITDYDLIEVKKYPIATFNTSRGCPGRCTFCYNQGRQLRFYNAEKVIKSMTHVLDKYKIREFTIADDNFANLSNRTTKICKALEKYKVIFHCFLRVDQVYDKVMQELKKAGCWSIQFGFESGSQRILDFIHKDTTIKQNINAIKQCKKYHIFVDGSFMLGLPTETTKEMFETFNFIKKYKPDAVDVKIFKPYPSTELYEWAIENKMMTRPRTLDEWLHFCDIKDGNINLSKIPTPLLIKVANELSKTSYSVYAKKTLLLLANKHYKYVFLKVKDIIKSKLGLSDDSYKVKDTKTSNL